MPHRPSFWLNDYERQHQAGYSPTARDEAFFGFERVHVREKSGRVRQHFNSVAHVYDFMNTLLSFGIHHAWKRAAGAGVRVNITRP